MKITHIQVGRFVSKLHFSTKSPPTSTSLRQRETSACVPCRYHSLSCSCSQVLTSLITSSSVLNFTPRTAFLGLRRDGNLKVLGRGCSVHWVTLSSQILLWLPESSNLCVVFYCHAEETFLRDSCS
jgi:hypothetical protein